MKMLEINHCKKAFGETDVLHDISLNVEKGEVVAIIGPSGSGKSTFLRTLNLLEQPTGGTITFGRAMGYTREAAVRVSFLMAIPAVFGAGILEAVSAVKDVAAGNAGMFPGWGATIAATIVAFVVGYVVIIGFLKFVSTFSYKAFAIYRIALAVVVALLLICGVLHPTEVVAAA